MPAPAGFSRRLCAELLMRLGEAEGSWQHAAYLDRKSVIYRSIRVYGDVFEFSSIACGRDSIEIEMMFPGALSKARCLEHQAYTDFLSSLLESNNSLNHGVFAIDNGVLTFRASISFDDVRQKINEHERQADYDTVADTAVEAAALLVTAVSQWLEDALRRLERGGRVEPLDIEREAEKVETGSGGAVDPLVVMILQR